MPTLYTHRLTLIVPAARCATVNAKVRERLDPTGADWLTPSLSHDGKGEPTHAICGVALTDSQHKAMLTILAEEDGKGLPSDWDAKGHAGKIDAAKALDLSSVGIKFQAMDNRTVWDDAATLMADAGVQPVVVEPK